MLYVVGKCWPIKLGTCFAIVIAKNGGIMEIWIFIYNWNEFLMNFWILNQLVCKWNKMRYISDRSRAIGWRVVELIKKSCVALKLSADMQITYLE